MTKCLGEIAESRRSCTKGGEVIKALEYPLVRLYFDEAEKALSQGLHISCIAVSGILTELMARELASDERSNLVDVLKKLFKDKKISPKQFEWFNTIRLVRNRYIHINIGKEIETSFMGMVKEEPNGSMTFLKELIVGSDDPETEAIKLHKLCAESDACEVSMTLEKLIDALNL